MATQTSIPMHGGTRPGWIGCPLSVTAHHALLAKARKRKTTLGNLIMVAVMQSMDVKTMARPEGPYTFGQHETTHALHGLDVYVYAGAFIAGQVAQRARKAGERFPGRWVARVVREHWMEPTPTNNPKLF